MKYKRGCIFFILCFFAFPLFAQEAPAETEETPLSEEQEIAGEDVPNEDQIALEDETPVEIQDEGPKVPEKEQQRIELELKTSTLPELAAWCRSLGLSEGGTRAELASRIREHFRMSEQEKADAENQKIITIESAQTTEYFSIDVIDEDYARLKGEVRIILRDKEDEHRIKADEIIFNRTRNILTAIGNVEYTKVKGDTTEIFRGKNITVNIDNWASIFLDGNSDRMLESEEGTAYRFKGAVISITEDDVMILRKAEISNAYNGEALWSITASRLWLLPGSDFAIFNAWLKVGEIPVLYIPFFFFAADDVIFRPVIGYRTREGGFVQTTTYILGRPKADATAEQSSITRIMGNSSDMERERQGIFLRSTGKKVKDPNEISLKFMADYYTNLGAYLAVDFSMPKKGILNPLDFSIGFGLSRTLSPMAEYYTPYAPNYDGTFEKDYSNLFSKSVPFRYRLKTSSSINGKYGSLSWDFPFYSDPTMDKDFLSRAESMDWMNMLQQGAAVEDEILTENDISSYQWQMSGNFNPQLKVLAPYVNNISLTNISTTLAFKSIMDKDIYNVNKENPASFFFAPDKYTIYNASVSISGTPLSIGGQGQASAADSKTKEEETNNPLKDIGTPRSPWITKEEEEKIKASNDDKLIPPVLNQRFDLPKAGNLKFGIDYQLSPTSSSELQFISGYDRWQKNDQVNWGDIQSVLTGVGGNGSVNFRVDHSSGLFSNTVTFSGSGTWRDYTYINEEAEAFRTSQRVNGEIVYGETDEDKILAARKQQYRQTNYTTSYAYNGTVRPLYDNPIFGQSNVQYSFRGTLVRSKKYEDGDGPELRPQWGVWAKEETKDGVDIYGLNSHKIAGNIAANIMDYQQNMSISADLPPFDPLISTNATFRAWISETNARIDFKKPEMINNVPNEEWIKDPFHLTETLKFGKANSFSYYMVVDPEENNEITTITSSLTLWSFRASFSATKSLKYEFNYNDPDDTTKGGAWQQTDDDPALHPRDLTLTYNPTFSNIDIIKDRLKFSLNLNTRLFFDLQRYTNSNFQFTLGFTFNIVKFLDLTLSATSENTVVFRYFKGMPGMEDLTAMYIDGDQNNIFIDLFDSFNFGDDTKRQRSGFKIKSLNLTAVHHLGDWTAELGLSVAPYLNNNVNPAKYELNTELSFLVQWSAITEIKTDLRYEKRTEKWTKE
ncbi:MAG: LPS-assembly protein LptD [Treponema sp.]|jgi:lipopolysaccharide assembly outer membrane protein LptD (OstA)|nr:LPS-assembly protein LptD [Treponema sp.]